MYYRRLNNTDLVVWSFLWRKDLLWQQKAHFCCLPVEKAIMSADPYENASQTLTFLDTDDVGATDFVADTQASQYDYEFTLPSQTQTQQSQLDNHLQHGGPVGSGQSPASGRQQAPEVAGSPRGGKMNELAVGMQEMNFEETFDEEDTTYTKDLPKHACRYCHLVRLGLICYGYSVRLLYAHV